MARLVLDICVLLVRAARVMIKGLFKILLFAELCNPVLPYEEGMEECTVLKIATRVQCTCR